MGFRLSLPPFVTRTSQRTRDVGRRAADRVRLAALARPRLTLAALFTAVPAAWLLIVAVAWFTYDVTHTLPGRREVRSMGNMDQATVLYDVADRPVFTIFKEQRIEVPLAQMSPNVVERGALGRGSALLHPSRRRRDPHHGCGPRQSAEWAVRPGRIDGDAAAGAPELPHARAEPVPQDQGSHPRRPDRADLLQAGDPRALPEQGVLRRRLPRRRGGGTRLLRQVGVGADGRGGGADRRHHQVAVDVGAHRQHGQGGGPPQHRPGDDAREPEDRPRRRTIARAARRCTCRTACSATSRSASTSRSRCGASWSTASAGAASRAAGCASTRRSIRRCSRPPSARSRPGWWRSRSARATSTRRAPSSWPRSGASSRTASGRPTCRAAWSPSIRVRAKSASWSAAAPSPRAASTAPSRPAASRARRSSRSSTPRRSKPASPRRA